MSKDLTVRRAPPYEVTKPAPQNKLPMKAKTDAIDVQLLERIPSDASRPKGFNILTAPISSLTIEELQKRMDSPANRPRKRLFGRGYNRTSDYNLCRVEYKRKAELADADHNLALMGRYAKEKALKKSAAWDECSAVGAGARPEYRSAEEVNND